MKRERRAALLAITENVEMELLSSQEPFEVIQALEKEEDYSYNQRHLEHPLVPDCEEEEEEEEEKEEEKKKEEPVLQVQNQPRQQTKPKTEPPAKKEAKSRRPVPRFMEEQEIEMEVFPPLGVSQSEPAEDGASITTPPSPDKAGRLKWKRPTPQKTGLVVRDVVCLLRGHLPTPLERHVVPRSKERAALMAMGLTARITIDYSWSANQMQSRLAMLFRGPFVKQAGRRFSFTFLQCVQGSRVLFVPDAPAEGWTGEQVIRISGHGSLYILCHQDCSQAESERSASETPAVNGKDSCLGASTESCRDEDSQLGRQTHPHVGKTKQESALDLDAVLRRHRQENADRDVEHHVSVMRRGDVLHGALQEVRRPGFCFRTTPVVSFSGEETDGREGPLREFFRLTLLELQDSSVFEGLPGRLFLTYDLAALEDRKYYEAGVLIGWSLAHGGPGPQCLHPALYQLMCGRNPSLDDFSWRDIVDTETRIRLQQLHSCTDVKLLSSSLCDWVSSCGIPGIHSARSDEISAIYVRLFQHHIYHRVASMISQFTEGLNSCGGLWDTMRSHWDVFVPVMTSGRQQRPLTLEEFRRLFTVCYSRSDSQLRPAEEATAGHWETVLTLVSDGQAEFSFEDLLTFITGADHLPPLGLPRLISLRFYSQDAGLSGVRLPYASTRALELFLPRGAAAAVDLLMLLSRAVHEAPGFTQACN